MERHEEFALVSEGYKLVAVRLGTILNTATIH
jgi:hypothetical protein